MTSRRPDIRALVRHLDALRTSADDETVDGVVVSFVQKCRQQKLTAEAVFAAVEGWIEGAGAKVPPSTQTKSIVDGLFSSSADESNYGLAPIEPWPDAVDVAVVLDEVEATLRRYVYLSDEALKVLALWVAVTWCIDAFACAPRVLVTSPEKRCGKSRLFGVLRHLVNRPVATSSYSAAALYRLIDVVHPTLLLDEADRKAFDEDGVMVAVLNAGFTRDDGVVHRCVGDDHVPKAFDCFGPIAFASIGANLPDTILDRAIIVEMSRLPSGHSVERLRSDKLGAELLPVRRKLARLAIQADRVLRDADPPVPQELNDRAADATRPLLAIADLAGGDAWPLYARRAISILFDRQESDPVSSKPALLAAIRAVVDECPNPTITSASLIDHLNTRDDGRWRAWNHGQGINVRDVARLLRPYRVSPATIRVGSGTQKGYARADLERVFDTYLPPRRPPSAEEP